MGDPIEIITWPNNTKTYKITTGGIIFSIRANNKSNVVLSAEPNGKPGVEVTLGHTNQVSITCGGNTQSCTPRNANLSHYDYVTFWLCWTSAFIKVGLMRDEGKPLLTMTPGVPLLHYITFGTVEGRSPAHWKFELPPIRHILQLTLFEEGQPRWKPCDNQLPDGVIIGGFENDEPLYIIRSEHQGSLTPGKFVPSLGLGFVAWGGDAHEKSEFQALCGYNITWVESSFSNLPYGAIEGGYSEFTHEPLYVGRALIDGNLIPGKVQPSHRVCYIPYKDKEVAMSHYEVLVVPNTGTLHEVPITKNSPTMSGERMVMNHPGDQN